MVRAATFKGRPFIFLCALLAALAVSGCSSSKLGEENPSREPERIVLIAPVHASEHGDAMRLGAEAAAKEFGVQLDYISFEPDEDAEEQLAAAIQAVQGGAAALLIDPASDEVLKELGSAASEAGVPIVTLNDERSARGIQASITSDNLEAGKQAGIAMAELLGGTGKVAVMQSDRISTDPDLKEREEAAREALLQYPGITLASSAGCGSLRHACWQAAKGLLDEGTPDGVLVFEATASLGLGDELKRRGWAGGVKVVAFGSEMEQLELLQEGAFHKLIVQNGFSMGYLGMKQAVALLSGERTDKTMLLETKVIDIDNMYWMNNQKMLFPFIQ